MSASASRPPQYSSPRRAVVSGLWKGVPLGEIKVRLLLSNGEEYPHSGRIIFSDMAVDPNTDTIEMRALFPNPDQELLPGAYVRVVFDRAVRDNVFAIPRDAVIRTAQELPSLSWARKACWKRAPSGRIR